MMPRSAAPREYAPTPALAAGRVRKRRFRFVTILSSGSALLRRVGLAPIARMGLRLAHRVLRGDLQVEVDGLIFTGALQHRGYLRRLAAGRVEATAAELFKGSLAPGMVVVDAGAFLGYYTLLAARAVGETGHVFALEPDPRNLAFLRRNISENGLADRVTVWSMALSDRSGDAEFFVHPDHCISSLYAPRDRATRITVRCATLDQLIDESTVPQLVKIDIEGGELPALHGARSALTSSVQPLTLFIECNPKALRAAGGSPESLVEHLRGMGLSVNQIDEGSSTRVRPIAEGAQLTHTVNLYCTRATSPTVIPVQAADHDVRCRHR